MTFLYNLELKICSNNTLPPPPSLLEGGANTYILLVTATITVWSLDLVALIELKITNSEINEQNPCIHNTLLCTFKIMISFNPCHSIQVVVQSISPNSVLLEDTYIQLVALTTKYRFFLKPDQLSPIICRQAAFTFTLPCSLKDSA